MMLRKKIFLLACFFTAGFQAAAQETHKPEAYGVLKARYENDTAAGLNKFDIRNARIGFRGFATDNIRYALQIEAAPFGTIGVTDAYVGYKIGGFELVAGLQSYGLSAEVSRGAGRNYFANRSFVAKFLTQYYSDGDNPILSSIGARDLGAMLTYRYAGLSVPFEVAFGLFNGSGSRIPHFRNGFNMAARLDVGSADGLGGSAGYYGGNSVYGERLDMWSASLRYHTHSLHVEAEAGRRYQGTGERDAATVGVIYALYRFFIPSCSFVKSIAPILRFDVGDNVKFIGGSGRLESFNAQRITAGITIGLDEREFRSEIRLNYEHYFVKDKPSDYDANSLLHNKFTVEFFTAF